MSEAVLEDDTSANVWGNGLALRLKKAVTEIVGIKEGSLLHITAERGKLTVEVRDEPWPTLEERLAMCSTGGYREWMPDSAPVGNEFR
jgi:antitoxin component of MazEF toxin-antitoxin module